MTKERLHYFDMLKGIAIFMVVMGHVITFCIREIDRAAIFKFIGEIHMPLFFFISGWFSWNAVRSPNLTRRALQLLVPMAVCSTLWIWYFPHSGLESPLDSTFCGLWTSDWKNGYWFTLVLFEITAVYAALHPVLLRCRTFASEALVWAIAFAAVFLLDNVTAGTLFNAVASIPLVSAFFCVFAFGASAARHRESFLRLVRNEAVFTAAILVGALTLYMKCWYWEFPFMDLRLAHIAVGVTLHVCLAIVGVGVVRPWGLKAYEADKPGLFAAMWSYVGSKSLSIYLLHYFFLFPLGCLREPLVSMNVAFVPVLCVSIAVAVAITCVVLCVERLLRPSAVLSWLLCGTLPPFISEKFKRK